MFNKITKFFISIIFASTLMINQSNAATITQDLLFIEDGSTVTELIGSLTISTLDLDNFDETDTWIDFTLLGFGTITQAQADALSPTLFGSFLAVADPSDPWAGIELLMFDVTESMYGQFHFNGIADVLAGDHFLDVFQTGVIDPIFYGELFLGNASVIPEPAIMAMMLLGLALLSRRLSR